MIVGLDGSKYDGYFLTEHPSSFGYNIDITQKFWERYQAFVAEEEFIHCKLHKWFKECQERELLKKAEKGIPSKGF